MNAKRLRMLNDWVSELFTGPLVFLLCNLPFQICKAIILAGDNWMNVTVIVNGMYFFFITVIAGSLWYKLRYAFIERGFPVLLVWYGVYVNIFMVADLIIIELRRWVVSVLPTSL